jgi:hypothetical protein
LQEVPNLNFFITHAHYRRIFPLAAEFFGLIPNRIYGDDIFVLKYENSIEAASDPDRVASPAQASVKAHLDDSIFTYLIPLTDDFEGGGTRFVYSEEVYKPKRGTLLLFSGKNMHEGLPVTKGIRYVLAGRMHYGGPVVGKDRDPVVYTWDL